MLLDAARTPNESNQNPKPNYQVQGGPVCGEKEEIEKRTKFDHDTLNQEKRDGVTDSTSTARPVCGHESTKRCVLTPKHVREDQTGTGRPVLVDQKEEHELDFRVAGLSHAVVKEAGHLRVPELVKRIETHPHREALDAGLQQNNVCNPFSKKFEGNDPRIGQCRVIRVVRNCAKSTMFSLSSFLETRNSVLHLRTILDLQRIQKKVLQTKTGCNLYPELRDQERCYHGARHGKTEVQKDNTTWLGMRGRDAARKSTPKVNIYWYSRSISQRSSLS